MIRAVASSPGRGVRRRRRCEAQPPAPAPATSSSTKARAMTSGRRLERDPARAAAAGVAVRASSRSRLAVTSGRARSCAAGDRIVRPSSKVFAVAAAGGKATRCGRAEPCGLIALPGAGREDSAAMRCPVLTRTDAVLRPAVTLLGRCTSTCGSRAATLVAETTGAWSAAVSVARGSGPCSVVAPAPDSAAGVADTGTGVLPVGLSTSGRSTVAATFPAAGTSASAVSCASATAETISLLGRGASTLPPCDGSAGRGDSTARASASASGDGAGTRGCPEAVGTSAAPDCAAVVTGCTSAPSTGSRTAATGAWDSPDAGDSIVGVTATASGDARSAGAAVAAGKGSRPEGAALGLDAAGAARVVGLAATVSVPAAALDVTEVDATRAVGSAVTADVAPLDCSLACTADSPPLGGAGDVLVACPSTGVGSATAGAGCASVTSAGAV